MHNSNYRLRVRHGVFVALEMLVLTLLVAGLSWTLLKTVAQTNARAAECMAVETVMVSSATASPN